MTKLRYLSFVVILFAFSLPAVAQSTYMLAVSPTNAQSVISNHGLTIIKELYDGPFAFTWSAQRQRTLIRLETEVESDLRVGGFEPDQIASLPELSGLTQATLTQSNTSILDPLSGVTAVTFFGSTVPSNYATQAATNIIRLNDARTATHLTGSGIVGIIDTGADPTIRRSSRHWWLVTISRAKQPVFLNSMTLIPGWPPNCNNRIPAFWTRRTYIS